jgi:hypothetical protein
MKCSQGATWHLFMICATSPSGPLSRSASPDGEELGTWTGAEKSHSLPDPTPPHPQHLKPSPAAKAKERGPI